MTPVLRIVRIMALMNAELATAPHAAAIANERGQVVRIHDARRHCVLEVVTDVGNTVGPTHDFALGSTRGRSRPRVVADSIKGLNAEVEG
jgi:hypothetical protein